MISRLVFLQKSMTKLPAAHDANWRLSACIPPQKNAPFLTEQVILTANESSSRLSSVWGGPVGCDSHPTAACREKHGCQLWPAAASVPPRHLDPWLQRDPSRNRGSRGSCLSPSFFLTHSYFVFTDTEFHCNVTHYHKIVFFDDRSAILLLPYWIIWEQTVISLFLSSSVNARKQHRLPGGLRE